MLRARIFDYRITLTGNQCKIQVSLFSPLIAHAGQAPAQFRSLTIRCMPPGDRSRRSWRFAMMMMPLEGLTNSAPTDCRHSEAGNQRTHTWLPREWSPLLLLNARSPRGRLQATLKLWTSATQSQSRAPPCPRTHPLCLTGTIRAQDHGGRTSALPARSR